MKCPACREVDLAISERQGVEIDYCPQCRGVWLDRGELDKILERAAQAPHRHMEQHAHGGHGQQGYPQGQQGYPQGQGRYEHSGHKKKRESFLDDLFDF